MLLLGLAIDAAIASALGAGRLFGATRGASTNPAEPDHGSVGATATNRDGAAAQAGAPVPVGEHATPRPEETRGRNARAETAGGDVARASWRPERRLGRLAARWWVGPVAGALLACAIMVASAGFQWRRARVMCDACCDTSSGPLLLRIASYLERYGSSGYRRFEREFGFRIEAVELAQGIGPLADAACVCTDHVAVLAFRGRIIDEEVCE